MFRSAAWSAAMLQCLSAAMLQGLAWSADMLQGPAWSADMLQGLACWYVIVPSL